MNKTLSMAFAAMLSAAPFAPALAVDIENQDERTYHLVIENENGESKELEIGAGENAENICGFCYISLDGQEPLAAEGDEIVLIKGGVLTIKS